MIFGIRLIQLLGLTMLILDINLWANEIDSIKSTSSPRLTVWIHGTTIRAIIPFKIRGFHFDSKLIHFSELKASSQAYWRAVLLNQGNKEKFPIESFYLFRWNGMLNHKEREVATRNLYENLLQRINQIKQQAGKDPVLTIIAHSHGGNIALNLAALNFKNQSKILIHELILLACPVQASNADWINHETFQKVYIFYSSADWIQRLALQNGRSLADRTFNKIIKVSDKLVHVKTSWKNYRLWHNDFKSLAFVQKLPGSLQLIDERVFDNHIKTHHDYLLTI